jgi:hypothetical protein
MGQVACQLTLDRSQVNQLGKRKKKATDKNSIKPANASKILNTTQHHTTDSRSAILYTASYCIFLGSCGA